MNKVLLVFDAGPSFFPSCDKIGSLEIYYAGQHQTADDWIKSWLEKNRQRDILLVSSDREVRNYAHALYVTSISSQDFYKIFNEVLSEQEAADETYDLSIYKMKRDEPCNEFLDELMKLGAKNMSLAGNKHLEDQQELLVAQGKKISKSDKSLLKKIDKI